jgi:hypothetical protein
MSRSRVAYATLAACAAAYILSTHAFVAIDLLRVKVVQSPVDAANGRVRVTTAGLSEVNALRAPFPLIARIANRSAETGAFVIALDGLVACPASVPAGRTSRVDCVVTRDWSSRGEHIVTVEGPTTSWALEYLELATHHGGTTGAHSFVVLPGHSGSYSRPSPVWVGVASLVVLLMLLAPARGSLPPWIWRLYIGLAGVLVVVLAAIQCSQWLTPFRIVVSVDTFTMWLGLLLAPRIWFGIQWSVRRAGSLDERWTGVARAGFVALGVFLVFGALVQARVRHYYGGNYSGLLLVSDHWFDSNPALASRDDIRKTLFLNDHGGYDGQFMYFAAFDPFLRAYKDAPIRYREVVDDPPYRFGRIGFSLLTRVISGGRWERYPATMVWLVLASVTLAAFCLALMAHAQGANPAIGLLVLAVPGFWQSIQAALPEPIAAAALLGGMICLACARWIAAGMLLALSLLVRETGSVAVVCVLAAALASHGRRPAVLVGLFAFGVLLLWRLYVASILFPAWGIEGLLAQPANLGWPLKGTADLWGLIARGQYYDGRFEFARAGIACSLLVTGGLILAVALALWKPSAVHIAAVVYGLVAICLAYASVWVHVGNGQRVTYELFVMLAVSSVAIRTYPKGLQRGLVAFWSCSLAYVFFLTFDASYIRSALAIPF